MPAVAQRMALAVVTLLVSAAACSSVSPAQADRVATDASPDRSPETTPTTGDAVPSPRPSTVPPTATAAPTTPTPSPTPRLTMGVVSLGPSDLPFEGYEQTREFIETREGDGARGLFREFRLAEPRDYWWFTATLYDLTNDATRWLAYRDCRWFGSQTAVETTQIDAPAIGTEARACVFTFGGNFAPVYKLYTGTGPWGFAAAVSPRSPSGRAQVMDVLGVLARHQLAIIERLASSAPRPARPVLVAAATPVPTTARLPMPSPTPTLATVALPPTATALTFTPRQPPTAVEGETYAQFTFCEPTPSNFALGACGPFPQTTNPRGGSPPYHFQLDSGTGFPPIGMSLGKDGQLTGTPSVGTGGRSYRFVVCAIDLSGTQACVAVVLQVDFPVARSTPTPTRTPDQTAYALALTSKTCTPTQVASYGFNVTRYSASLRGTASGPVGAYVPATTCTGWTLGSGTCRRRDGDPPTTAWTLEVTANQDRLRSGETYVISLQHSEYNLRDRGELREVSYSCP